MRFQVIIVSALSALLVASHPIGERAAGLAARAPPAPAKPAPAKPAAAPAKPPAGKNKQPIVTVGPEGSITDQYRKQNAAMPRQQCKTANDCNDFCKGKTSQGAATVCDFGGMARNKNSVGQCRCDDKKIGAIATAFSKPIIEGLKKMGDSTLMKAFEGLLKGLATVQQVAGIIMSKVLPPGAKQAVGLFLDNWNVFGNSYLDEAASGTLKKALDTVKKI